MLLGDLGGTSQEGRRLEHRSSEAFYCNVWAWREGSKVKVVKKVIKQKNGNLVPFEYVEPENLQEALQTLGEKKMLQAIRYTIGIVERKKALAPPSTPRGLRKLLRLHPDRVRELLLEVEKEDELVENQPIPEV